MTRIIAGRLGGRRLTVPEEGTRPTSDRVREALFSLLAARIDLDGAEVLDLYAGSGALGIEAHSRGAGAVTFVDARRRATSVIGANASALGIARSVQVVTASVASYLAGAPRSFDLVLSDPPYDLDPGLVAADLRRIADGWLAPGGLVVLERARRTTVTWPDSMAVIVEKRYGDTVVEVGGLAQPPTA
ncbi:MAG: 16S rRNA (guanine(966)-N(2))-methyltransferase RsmD [Gordonia sp. (in: high G+C Gram-positive bacteria)]